jgi:hypothetical protein
MGSQQVWDALLARVGFRRPMAKLSIFPLRSGEHLCKTGTMKSVSTITRRERAQRLRLSGVTCFTNNARQS